MEFFQMLDGNLCSTDIESCCSDYGIATYIYIIKQVLNLIHIIVPIILMVMLTVQLIKLMTNPDDQGGKEKKSLINKAIAAVIIFLIPTIMNIVLGMLPKKITLSGCWDQADLIVTVMNEEGEERYNQRQEIIEDSGVSIKYDKRTIKNSKKQKKKKVKKQVVEYAKSFVGKGYSWGGTWSGELPYSNTDCSGFVKGIYNHFGYSIPRTSTNQSKVGKQVSENDLQLGDLIFYGNSSVSHVAMYIGEGKIVHASNKKNGIKITNDYKYRTPLAIRRIIN